MRFTNQAIALAATALLASTAFSAPSFAAPAAPAAAPAAPAAPPAKPVDPNAVVATVNGEKITVSDVQDALGNMPPQMRQLPPNMIYPMLVNQLADQKAIQLVAHKEGLDKTPEVQKMMAQASANALQNAWLSKQVTPQLTDAAIQDYYQQNYAGKPAEQEVHARHILVKTEAEATDAIKKLKAGEDFGKLAAQISTDTGSAKQNGGDLGWFKKEDMIPAFSDAAFAMKKGEISSTPVKSQYGYHVIQVLDTRTDPIPALDSVKDKIRQALIQKYVRDAVGKATAGVKIVRFDPATGKQLADAPPPAAAPAAPAKK
ncbi:peptidyl-prolyl cis-trans isomerase [Acetobacter indonesiensis NRIC 0313]|nr:peptidylprolyl isomerase [Acetobacter indonesiensis]MCG0994811.1 peptidylprolyl isomerase [Acetobacter indonesiensis]MCI1437796.1 peptidylprolyl isomerase [Acetobacter indonesiensis]MCI1546682.1 peptidylprolyl isomerase [Acetobacter indonesiensis]MCI1766034.1 peptidylprolyl isomerase [Acetobacter indonesiensis]OUI92824.1 peptidylprolyl isomerase [Acetobacter indonesiensis]